MPVGLAAAEAGSYEFSLDHADGIFQTGQDMYILDNFTGLTHNLRDSNYSFTTEAGTFNDRFAVVFAETLGDGSIDANGRNIIAYGKNGQLNIAAPGQINAIQLYDLRGRLLYGKEGIASDTFSTPILPVSQGVVIIKLTMDDNSIAFKKIVVQ